MQTLSERVTETLRDWILHGHFKPGDKIEEVPIAERMGVSRTPVRAAFATLTNEGLQLIHQINRQRTSPMRSDDKRLLNVGCLGRAGTKLDEHQHIRIGGIGGRDGDLW